MVCTKCEKKLSRGIHQEMWKEGSRNTVESGGRRINENKALTAKGKTGKWTPYGAGGAGGKCRICKLSLHQEGIFCQKCAYAQGQCSMCGVKVWDTTYHNVGGIREAPAGGDEGGDEGGVSADAAAANETKTTSLTVEEQEARDATEKEAREEAERVRAEKAERARRTADAVASNRLAGSTSLASAAREMATAAAGKAAGSMQANQRRERRRRREQSLTSRKPIPSP